MENQVYECVDCDYWEAVHGLNNKDYKNEKYKKCVNCGKRVQMYKEYLRQQEV